MHVHPAFRQRAGLVRHDDGDRPECFHSGEPPDRGPLSGYALDSERQGDGEHGWQPFGHRCHRQRQGEDDHLWRAAESFGGDPQEAEDRG